MVFLVVENDAFEDAGEDGAGGGRRHGGWDRSGGLPVFDFEAGDAGEFAEVVRDDGRTEAEGLGGDEGVHGADYFTATLQVCTEATVAERIFGAEGFYGDVAEQAVDPGSVAGEARFGGPVFEFGEDQDREAQVGKGGREFLGKPGVPLLEVGGDDVGIGQEDHQSAKFLGESGAVWRGTSGKSGQEPASFIKRARRSSRSS